MSDMRIAGFGERPPHGDEPLGARAAPVVFLESALWKRLNDAASPAEVGQAWLVLQCRMIRGATAGLLLLRDGKGTLAPAAYWPEGEAVPAALPTTADVAVIEKRGVVGEGAEGEGPALAYPVIVGEEVAGVVAVALDPRDRGELKAAMRQVQWGIAALRDRIGRDDRDGASRQQKRLKTTLDFIATALEHERFVVAARAVVTELAVLTKAERVSLGFVRRGSSHVVAISHSAQFGKQMNLVNLLAGAMDEAVDQQAVVVYPPPDSGDPVATSAHARLAEAHRIGHILTLPLMVSDHFVGALTLESPPDRPFDADTIALLDGLGAAIGPILDEKRQNDRWIGAKAAESVGRQLRRLFGPGYLGRKVVATLVVAAVAFLAFAQGDYRVTADSRLEGLVRRAIVAPTDGFIKDAAVRAGDTVKAGQQLAALDDRDLVLERLKLVTERQQYVFQNDKALAARELATVNVTRSQIEQADAEIRLIDEQLARAKLTAPFDGIVVSGDLSQQIGAPVPRGEVLFEIAPLDGYRVNIAVDERQIADIAVGQKGEMLAASLPGEAFPFTVEKITPLAEQRSGRNVFRVEAKLDETSPRLRPGMEGVARIGIDRRLLVSIWMRPFIDWARVWFWSWSP